MVWAACHWMFSSIGESDSVYQTAMISACAKTGDFAFARKLFDKMPHKDPVVWNAMISRYAYCGRSRKVSSYIQLLQGDGVKRILDFIKEMPKPEIPLKPDSSSLLGTLFIM